MCSSRSPRSIRSTTGWSSASRSRSPGATAQGPNQPYSCYTRLITLLNMAYNPLDLVPKGRDEDGLDFTLNWLEYHERSPRE